MKAAVIYKFDEPLVVEKLYLKDQLKCGQVLVEVRSSGICGAQLGHISGVKIKKEFYSKYKYNLQIISPKKESLAGMIPLFIAS